MILFIITLILGILNVWGYTIGLLKDLGMFNLIIGCACLFVSGFELNDYISKMINKNK